MKKQAKTKTKAKTTKAKAKKKKQKNDNLRLNPEYQKIRGYAWEKHTKNGKPCLTIKLDDVNYLAVKNLDPVNPKKSPSYWLQYKTSKNQWLQVGAIWEGKTKEGFSFKWLKMEQTFILLPNPNKLTAKSPDYIIKLSYLNAKGTTPFYTKLTLGRNVSRLIQQDSKAKKRKAKKSTTAKKRATATIKG